MIKAVHSFGHLIHPQGQPSHINLSRGLAALGRGPDTELVHMSNKEVNGLQNLAMAHGGSLTRNPHTGLLEAGWLENILPMVAGGVLAATGVGAPAAALLVGATDALVSKDWKSGLAAGLGAFGGAGLAAGLAGAGASAASAAAPAATSAASDAASTAATAASTGANAASGAAGAAGDLSPITTTASKLGAVPMDVSGDITPIAQPEISIPTPTMPAIQTAQEANQAALSGGFGQSMSNIGQGIQTLGTTPGATASNIYASTGKLGFAGLAAPAMYANYKQSQLPSPTTPFTYYSTTYNQGRANPNYGIQGQAPLVGQGYGPSVANSYTPLTNYKKGGIARFAMGGDSSGAMQMQPMPMRPPITQQPGQVGLTGNTGTGLGTLPIPQQLPRPTLPPAQQSQANMYQNLEASPTNQLPPPPPPTAMNNYLNMLNNQITGKVPTYPTQPNPTPKTNTGGLSSLGVAEGTGGSSSLGTGNLIYNPLTGTYTQSPNYGFGGRGPGGPQYAAGGRFLRGPGDGVSDSIPATIGGSQQAALADGEFVVPARAVSELGNGSSEAGSRKLYKMLDRIAAQRKKGPLAKNFNAESVMPG